MNVSSKTKNVKHDFSLIVIEGRCVSTAAAIIITNTDIPAVNEPSYPPPPPPKFFEFKGKNLKQN
jgi:hypothetical protein